MFSDATYSTAYSELPTDALSESNKFWHWLRTSLRKVGVNAETTDSITGQARTGCSSRKVYTAAVSLQVML